MTRFATGVAAAMLLVASCSTASELAPRPTGPPPSLISPASDAQAPAPPPEIESPELTRLALRPVAPDRTPDALQTIATDHSIDFADWASAGLYEVPDAGLIETVAFAFDNDHWYLRIDFGRDLLGDDRAGWDLYIEVPDASAKEWRSLLDHDLGFPASHVVSWRGTAPLAPTGPTPLAHALRAGAALEPDHRIAVGFDGHSQVIELPLDDLGPVRTGGWLAFRFVDRTGGGEGMTASGPVQVPLPASVTEGICDTGCGAGPR